MSVAGRPKKGTSTVGRPTGLTPEIQKGFVKYIREGNYFTVVAKIMKIRVQTAKEWLARGRGVSRRPADAVYKAFALAVDEAEAYAEAKALKAVLEYGFGSKTTERKTTTRPDGSVIVEETTKIIKDPASLRFFLERKYPERWSTQRILESEIAKVLLEKGRLSQEAVDMIIKGGEVYEETIGKALAMGQSNSSASSSSSDASTDDWSSDAALNEEE